MSYDNFSGKVMGIPVNPLPAMSGALHVKYVTTPMNPGLMVRAFEVDPFSGSRAIEQPLGQNDILTSGNALPATNPGQFYSNVSQQDFTLPRVVPEFAVAGSGLPGNLNDAYPALTHNIGASPTGNFNNGF